MVKFVYTVRNIVILIASLHLFFYFIVWILKNLPIRKKYSNERNKEQQ